MDKLDRMAQLRDDNATSLAEIARRQEQRAADPYFEEPPTIVKYDDGELTYKTVENVPAVPALSDVEKEAIAAFVVEFVRQKLVDRDKRITELETKIAMLMDMVKPRIIKP
jgi:hypothetical protein